MFAATKSFFAKAPAGGALTPSWSIDWSTGTPSGYTLTRASSGTYVDSSGYIASASTDVARLTHNSSGTRLGLLVEESRTNQWDNSEDFTAASYNHNGATRPSTNNTDPENTSTATRFQETAGGSTWHGFWRFGTPAGNKLTQSVFVKPQERTAFTLTMLRATNNWTAAVFDLTGNGSVSQTSNGSSNTEFSNVSASITPFANGWYRCSLSATTASNNFNLCFHSLATTTTPTLSTGDGVELYSGDATKGLLMWGVQSETETSPTAYIPTTTASVTRSADLAHVLDSSITSWGSPGALVIHFYPPGQAGTLLSTDDASAEQLGLQASSTTAARAFWSNGNTSTGTIGTGVQKAVHYWNGTNSRFCINGGTVQTGTNNITTFGNIDYVTFGAEATSSTAGYSQYANCIIRKIEFYSGTLTDANLQTITT
jgi:hypothetical protein